MFGLFLDVDFVFYSGLVHYFLLKDVVDVRLDVITFNIKGSNVTFSKNEFMLIIGLWRTHVTVAQKESTGYLVEKYFAGTFDRMKISTLEEIYKKPVFANDDDSVKVSLVLYAELAMMGKAKKNCNIENELFGEVEHLDYFNNIDWGTQIWEHTIQGLQTTLKNEVGTCNAKGRKNLKYRLKYNLTGFPIVLQVIFQTKCVM